MVSRVFLYLVAVKVGENVVEYVSRITGFEGQYAVLPKRDHAFTYPDELEIYSFESGDLSDYPPPAKDGIGTPSKMHLIFFTVLVFFGFVYFLDSVCFCGFFKNYIF